MMIIITNTKARKAEVMVETTTIGCKKTYNYYTWAGKRECILGLSAPC